MERRKIVESDYFGLQAHGYRSKSRNHILAQEVITLEQAKTLNTTEKPRRFFTLVKQVNVFFKEIQCRQRQDNFSKIIFKETVFSLVIQKKSVYFAIYKIGKHFEAETVSRRAIECR